MTLLFTCSGARVRRVIDPSRAIVPEHAHDWPVISLYVMGGYHNVTERGDREIAGPSMLFYGRGARHRNVAGDEGFEQIEIEFDGDWLGSAALPVDAVLARVGGGAGALAQTIARQCDGGRNEDQLKASLRQLLRVARSEAGGAVGHWVGEVTARLRADPSRRIGDLARQMGRSPAWIGPAYRRSSGEGPQEAAARFRVERAARLLRETDQPFPDVALAAGFCDQSHMNRTFRRVLARSPTAVRCERLAFRQGCRLVAPKVGTD
jgi:AraC family transcriptional regulator